jgi:hypothetical protein
MTMVTSDNSRQEFANFFMRWLQSVFPKNNKNVMVANELEPGSVKWVATISDVEYDAYLDYLIDSINMTLAIDRVIFIYWISNNNSMIEMLSSAIHLIRKINRQKTDSRIIISRGLKTIIRVIDALNVYDIKTSPSDQICRELYLETKRNLDAISKSVKNSELLSNLTNDKWKNSSRTLINLKETYDLDKLKDFKNASSRFKSILDSLVVKENVLLNVEDLYILNEIENKYLPNMYNSAISLKASNENAIELIEHELNIQFDFMESEITRINNSLYAHAMNTLKSQSSFALTRMNEIKALN